MCYPETTIAGYHSARATESPHGLTRVPRPRATRRSPRSRSGSIACPPRTPPRATPARPPRSTLALSCVTSRTAGGGQIGRPPHRCSSAARHGGCRRRGHVGSPCPGVGPRAVSTRSPRPPLPSRLPAQRGAQLCGALRIRARRALALAQLKPGVEAAAHGERHAQTQRLARSAARRHPEVGRPARTALPPVKPVPHLKLVGLRRVDRRGA